MVRYLRGPEASDVAVVDIALNWLAEAGGAARGIYFPARCERCRRLADRLDYGHCPKCGKKVSAQGPQAITREILALPQGTKLTLLAPLVTHRKGEFKDLFDSLRGRGFVRISLDGQIVSLEDVPAIDKKKKHSTKS